MKKRKKAWENSWLDILLIGTGCLFSFGLVPYYFLSLYWGLTTDIRPITDSAGYSVWNTIMDGVGLCAHGALSLWWGRQVIQLITAVRYRPMLRLMTTKQLIDAGVDPHWQHWRFARLRQDAQIMGHEREIEEATGRLQSRVRQCNKTVSGIQQKNSP